MTPWCLTWRRPCRPAALVAAAAAVLALAASSRVAAAEPRPIAIVNGTLVDGSGARPVKDALVLIRGRRIVYAGPRRGAAVPAGARRVDVHGGTILPGLIDTHVHQAFSESDLRTWLLGGVTTVRDLGSGPDYRWAFSTRDSLNRSTRTARLLAVGPIVTVPGGYPQAIWGDPGLEVTSAGDARAKVTELIGAGCDAVKIAVETGSSWGRRLPVLSREEIRAIVEVAHAHGKRVTAHAMTTGDIRRAVEGGVDEIAHYDLGRIPQPLVEQMVAARVDWVPTLELFHLVPVATPPGNLARFVRAGGTVALGTDYMGLGPGHPYDHGMPIHELRLMHRYGMTAMQVLVAATRNAAVAVDRPDLGLVRTGKVADVIAVRGDPLASIEAMRRVALVVHDGAVVLDRTR